MRSTESRVRSTRRSWQVAIALLGAATLCAGVPAFGANVPSLGTISTNAQPTVPGTLSYLQGTVLLDGNLLDPSNAGNAEIAPGQVLKTLTGRAEVMLDPGIYLRLDDHSEAKMLTMAITPTRVEVEHGEIGVEVDELHDGNVLQVVDDGVTTQLVKTGYYEFNANSPMVKVFSGQAEVHARKGAWTKVGPRHEMVLADAAQAKPRGFQPDPEEEPMMAWNKLRSQYLTETYEQNNPEYGMGYGMGYGWGGPGWGGGGWGPGWGMGWRMGWGMGWGW